MNIVNIEALIGDNKILKTIDIDPANDYVVIGKYQNGLAKGGQPGAYLPFAVPLSELLGGGSAYTASNGIVLIGNDFQLAAGVNASAWYKGGNSFGSLQTIGTNDNFDFPIKTNNIEVARFLTTGEFVMGSTTANGQYMYLQKNQDNFTNGLIENNNSGSNASAAWIAQSDSTTLIMGAGSSTHNLFPNAALFGAVSSDIYIAAGISGTPANVIFFTGSIASETMRLDTVGNLGIGLSLPTARLHVRGVDATSGNFATKIEDVAGNRILSSRNDGLTFIGQRFCYVSSSNVLSSGELNIFGEQQIIFDTLYPTVQLKAANKVLEFQTWHSTTVNNHIDFAGWGSSGAESYIRTNDIGTLESGFKSYIGTSAVVGDTNFRHCFVNGNVHIGYDELVNTNTTKLTIRSRNTSGAQNNLLLQDSALVTLLKVSNSGQIAMPLLQTGNAGLAAGDLYVDTAANILANGDLVVGRKV